MQSSYTAVATCASCALLCGRHARSMVSTVVFGIERANAENGSSATANFRRRVIFLRDQFRRVGKIVSHV